MAGTFKLPEDVKEVYSDLASMPEQQYERFTRFIAGLPTGKVFTHTLDRVLRTQATDDRDTFFSTLNQVARLSRTAATLDVPEAEIIAAVIDQALPADSPHRQTLLDRLQDLLGNRAVNVHSRAFELLYEEQRYITNSTILTDIRPIFNAAGDRVEGEIIINHLHIAYNENGSLMNIFFALDEEDIEMLGVVSTRAKSKIKTLMQRNLGAAESPTKSES